MIKILQNCDKTKYPHLFEQMFRLRAQEFHERRQWAVSVKDGKEIDRFDDLDPVYVLVVNEDDEVWASLRLLPTTGPYMVADVFPELMAGDSIIRHPLIWESSRFCVDHTKALQRSTLGIRIVTQQLLIGAFNTAKAAGIERIISAADILVTRILKNCGCPIERFGQPVIPPKLEGFESRITRQFSYC